MASPPTPTPPRPGLTPRELRALQSHVGRGVLTTPAGGVSKRLFEFAEPVDPGPANWAGVYLDEALSGVQLGTRLLRSRFEDAGLSQRELGFLAAVRPAF